MTNISKRSSASKSRLHPRSKHRERYNLQELAEIHPPLAQYVHNNEYDQETIDFFNPIAVKSLNTALLRYHYGVKDWIIPEGYLTPPIPGRADYLHYAADLLVESSSGQYQIGNRTSCLDIGCGANLIFPILGASMYKWKFIASEIDELALEAAQQNLSLNPHLKNRIELRLQTNPKDYLFGILKRDEFVDLVICNPPFHSSKEVAESAALRKLKNLKKNQKIEHIKLNFGGQHNELWCEGGEKRFIKDLIYESTSFAQNSLWYTSLVSNKALLVGLQQSAKFHGAKTIKIIPMGQGNKSSHLLAWSFLSKKQQKSWFENHAIN